MLIFVEGGKLDNPEKKSLGARTRTNNKLSPHMTPGLRIEPRKHWWEASTLTTAPTLLPLVCPSRIAQPYRQQMNSYHYENVATGYKKYKNQRILKIYTSMYGNPGHASYHRRTLQLTYFRNYHLAFLVMFLQSTPLLSCDMQPY